MNAFITKIFAGILVVLHVLAVGTIIAFIFLPSFREFAYLTPFVDDLGNRVLTAAFAFISYVLVFGTLTAVIAIYQKLCDLNERMEQMTCKVEPAQAEATQTLASKKSEPSID